MDEKRFRQDVNKPWLDTHLSEVDMNHLWDILNHSITLSPDIMNNTLAGNISKSKYIKDKDNFLYENVLKQRAETLYFRDWNNYNNVHIAKSTPPPKFWLKTLWVNYQKQYEFNPPHNHTGLYSFVVFMKIPTDWKEQHERPISEFSTVPSASDFQFLIPGRSPNPWPHNIPLSSEDEGRLLFFPAWLNHQVFPFYGTDEERITISGNVSIAEPVNIVPESEYVNLRQQVEQTEIAVKIARETLAQFIEEEKK